MGGELFMRIESKALIGCLLLLPACAHRSHTIKKNIHIPVPSKNCTQKTISSEQVPPHITILIHGTKIITRSTYYTYFDGKPSLKHVSSFPKNSKTYTILKTLSKTAPTLFPYEHLYCFGWSGRLRVKERDAAAEALYDILTTMRATYYERYNVEPVIRLVCHSHGGNIALTLARINAQKNGNLTIDSLIALACPVQFSTKDFVTHALFNRIYAFYSSLDFVQIIAPEFSYYIHNEKGELIKKEPRRFPFSARRFDTNTPVKQARIKISRHALTHAAFKTFKFLHTLPIVINVVDDIYKQYGSTIVKENKEVVCVIKPQRFHKHKRRELLV